MTAATRECARLLRLELTDRVFGIGCHSRDWGDTLFQRPADAVIAGMFKALGVRTEARS
jgi:hypothetical protein